MNIDRDDEYATRYEAAPTIEEQIECCRDVKEKMQRMSISDPMNDAILASLEKLAALESQPVTVEPERVKAMRSDTWCGGDVSEALRYIDSLQSAQKLAQEKYEQAVSNKQIAEARFYALAFEAGRKAEREECAKDKVDAERYRFLRKQHEFDDDQASNNNYGKNYPPRTMCVFQDDGADGLEPVKCDPGALDEAIDRARSAK